MFSLCCLILIISYKGDLSKRNEFILMKNVEVKVEKATNVLSYFLPEFVRRRVKDGVRYIAEDKGTVSVIFIEICDFDYILTIYSSHELLSFLDDVFEQIDQLCESLGVTKIETVGKTYLACAGLKDSEVSMNKALSNIPHARRVVEIGLAVLRMAENIRLNDSSKLKFKIGINSGPVTAGVVGFHKPQFSLVGDTVNTASRMASTLTESNLIQMTLATYNLLGDKNGLYFIDRVVEAKGKGCMETKILDTVLHSHEPSFDSTSALTIKMNLSVQEFCNSPDKNEESVKFNRNELSFLKNLNIEKESQLLIRNSSIETNKLFSLFWSESVQEQRLRLEILENNKKLMFYGLLISVICNGFLIFIEFLESVYDNQGSNYYRASTIVIEEVFSLVLLKYYTKHHKTLLFSNLLSFLYIIEFFVFFIISFYDKNSVSISFNCYYFRIFLLNCFTGHLNSKLSYFNIFCISL